MHKSECTNTGSSCRKQMKKWKRASTNCHCWLSDIIVILCLDVLYDLSPRKMLSRCRDKKERGLLFNNANWAVVAAALTNTAWRWRAFRQLLMVPQAIQIVVCVHEPAERSGQSWNKVNKNKMKLFSLCRVSLWLFNNKVLHSRAAAAAAIHFHVEMKARRDPTTFSLRVCVRKSIKMYQYSINVMALRWNCAVAVAVWGDGCDRKIESSTFSGWAITIGVGALHFAPHRSFN
jgi:hypothetical protein